ncbi:MAG: trigger factor [Anaerolineales bacterium]
MKIETQPLEDHQVKLVVEVEPEPFEKAKRRAASRLSRRTKIPGFRPGKAPYQIVQRHIGEEVILEESLDILLKDLYPKIIEEAEIEPHGPGKLENVVSVDPLKLEFVVPLASEVELGDYRSIRFPYEPEETTEQDVEDVLQDLRHRQAMDEPVERPAQEGDHVYIRLSAERVIAEEGQDPALIADRPQSLLIASEDDDMENEWPFSGFSRELIGMSPGDEKSLTHTFPEDSDYEALKGVTAEFKVTMEEVKSRTLPELNDEFAQSVGDYAGLEELRSEIRNSLEQQNKKTYDDDYDDKILNEVVEQSTIKYPPQMLEEEIDEVLHQLEHRLESQNLDLDTYLMTREMDEDDLREEVKPVAEKRLKRSLVLLEISKKEDVDISPDEVQAETERALDILSRTMSEKDLRKLSTEQLVPNLVSNIMVDMRISKTSERLRSIAKGEEEASEEMAGEEPGEQLVTEGAATKEGGAEPLPEPEGELAADEVAEKAAEGSNRAEIQSSPATGEKDSDAPAEDESGSSEPEGSLPESQSAKEG